MTTVQLYYKNDMITCVKAKGHTNYAKQGQDIVCAAVSSLIQGALLGLKEVAKVKLEYQTSDGYLEFKLLEHNNDANAILKTMRLAIIDISKGYPSHIKLEETKHVY